MAGATGLWGAGQRPGDLFAVLSSESAGVWSTDGWRRFGGVGDEKDGGGGGRMRVAAVLVYGDLEGGVGAGEPCWYPDRGALHGVLDGTGGGAGDSKAVKSPKSPKSSKSSEAAAGVDFVGAAAKSAKSEKSPKSSLDDVCGALYAGVRGPVAESKGASMPGLATLLGDMTDMPETLVERLSGVASPPEGRPPGRMRGVDVWPLAMVVVDVNDQSPAAGERDTEPVLAPRRGLAEIGVPVAPVSGAGDRAGGRPPTLLPGVTDRLSFMLGMRGALGVDALTGLL